MRWLVFLAAALFFVPGPIASAATHSARAKRKPAAPLPDYSAFYVAGLEFTMPPKWLAVPAETPARAGQWKILVPHGATGEAGEVVAFFFGPAKGGTAKESIAAWIGTMFNAEGHPAAAETKTHVVNGYKISQVVAFGTYSQLVPMAGVPPLFKSDYGLIGTVVDNPQGNIYWRFTGPEPLVTANMPLFNKMIDSVKLQTK